jgi:hypothetical protein
MRGWELDRPPRWGIVALVVLLVVNGALFAVFAFSSQPADPYGESRVVGATAPAPTRPSSSPAAGPSEADDPQVVPVLAVYGDGYAAGNEAGGLGAAGWPAIVAERTKAQLQLRAVPQSGYASVGVNGQDFPALISAEPVPEADVTVIFGSRNDLGESVAAVGANATEAISTVRTQSPRTVIVVVGPSWDDAAVPAGLLTVRDAVRAAARAENVTFVDPLVDEWFADGSGLIAADGVSPNDEGHAYLADQLTPVVQIALAEAADPPA